MTTTKTKNVRKSLSAVVNELKKYPHTSSQYKKLFTEVSKLVSEKYSNQFILCTPSKFSTNVNLGFTSMVKNEGVISLDELPIKKDQTFFEDYNFVFKPRHEVEYNYLYKQIAVFGFITDGTQYIMLKKKCNNEVTMVGGHVDYSIDAYRVNKIDYLRQALQIEVDEEIDHNKQITVSKKPFALINAHVKFQDFFHMAFVYKIKVDSVDDLYKTIKSGEKRHDVVRFKSKKELLAYKNLNHWIPMIKSNL